MQEIESLVNNFVSIARERVFILAIIIFSLVHFDLAPAVFLTAIVPFLMLHSVQMFMVNKSFQANFAEQPDKFNKIIEIIDRVALGVFLAIMFTMFIFVVLL